MPCSWLSGCQARQAAHLTCARVGVPKLPRNAAILPPPARSAQAALEERRQQAEAAKGALEAAKEKLAGVAERLADAARDRAKLLAKLDK